MESNSSDKFFDEPNAKRPKIESEGPTSSKPESKDPFLTLPSDVLAEIIGYIPVTQWPSLELLDTNFRAATLTAWRQLRNVNVDRELLFKCENPNDRSSRVKFVKSIIEKFVERSPFMTSLSGIADLNWEMVDLLARFEHLQSITLGDAAFFNLRGVPLESAVHFLESTRSRTSLKELRLVNVLQWCDDPTIRDRFATSFVNGREIQTPLKLEKFSFSSSNRSFAGHDTPLRIRLDTMDTSRLTELCVGKASIEPQQLTDLLERASNLRRIELSFLKCRSCCIGRRLQANKDLLTALALHENLTAIKFDNTGNTSDSRCLDFRFEFIEMLKAIGRRGKLTSLAMEEYFVHSCGMNVNEIYSAIGDYIPYLKSIRLDIDRINVGSAKKIVSLAELEEISFFKNLEHNQITADEIRKISELPRLRCLAIDLSRDNEHHKSLEYLANATALTHLRMRFSSLIKASIFAQCNDKLASNLRSLMLWDIDAYKEDDVEGLIRLLRATVQLRVLIVKGRLNNRLLTTIAQSCPDLEILGAQSRNGFTAQHLQQIVDRCPKLKKLGGFGDTVRSKLRLPKYRKIVDVDMEFWKHDFDSKEYE